jgi:hypothetical protein
MMQLGDTATETQSIWRKLAPLYWLYEVEETKPGAQILADAALTSPNSEPPLILFQYVGAGRVLFHAIDSTWRWRLGAGDAYFARYWVQAVRFLARGKLASGRGAQLTTDRREYRSGEGVRLRARFFDPRLIPAGDDVTASRHIAPRSRRRGDL